jgi:tRNA dimethylallyltransferase
MLAGGAVEEVRRAAFAGGGARRAIGFREIEDFLAGGISESECREAIATATWRYAKRQLTWCRTQFDFPALDLTQFSSTPDAVEKALGLLAEHE